jgi:DNA-binding XRE family transcriptional regulator
MAATGSLPGWLAQYRLQSMLSIEEQLGIDTSDPEIKRAEFLADQIAELLQHLVAVRKRRGLTQADLAKKLNVTQATIAAFERSSNDPKLSTVRKYANAVTSGPST